MSNPENEVIVNLIRKCLRLTGVWPGDTKNSSFKLFACNFSFFFFIWIPQATKLFIVRNNLNDSIHVLTIGLLMYSIAFCKYFNHWYKKQGKNL